MICTKCDPAGHVAGEEREYLKRAHDEKFAELKTLSTILCEVAAGSRPPSRFTGERIAVVLRDLDAIQNLQIVVGTI